MKKSDSENAIKQLISLYIHENEIDYNRISLILFSDFKNWAISKGYSDYFNFRSAIGSAREAEMWFDEEIRRITLPR